PEAAFCFSNMEWFWSESGRAICRHFGLLQKPSTRLEDIIADFSIPTPTVMIRREKMGDLRYRTDLDYVNDYYFIVELMRRGAALYVPRLLVRYRKHRNSATLQNFFYEDREKLLALLYENLPAAYKPAIERY